MDTPAEAAANRLAWEAESWKSIELRVVHHYSGPSGAGNEGVPVSDRKIDDHYIETSIGQRRGELLVRPSEGKENLFISYSDGKRCAETAHSAGYGSPLAQVVIQPSFGVEGTIGGTSRPIPLKYFYAGKLPLQKALANAESLGETKEIGRKCDRFLFKNIKWAYVPGDVIFHLDRETGVPLRVRFFLSPEDRANDLPNWDWRALSLDLVDGHHMPLKSVETCYTGKAIRSTRELEVTEIAYDREYPATTFWPETTAGIPVWDNINNKFVGVPRTNQSAAAAQHRQSVAIEPRLRAEPPASWSNAVGGLILALGVAAVFASFVLWRRRG